MLCARVWITLSAVVMAHGARRICALTSVERAPYSINYYIFTERA